MTTLGELIEDKSFICSTNVERALLHLLVQSGLPESDVVAQGKYDKQMGDAKERIYKEFSKILGFTYNHDSGYYDVKTN